MAWSIAYETPTQNTALQVAAGALGLTGGAPVVGIAMIPPAGALSVVGQAVNAVLATTLVPPVGALSLSGLVSTVVTAQTNIRPPAGAVGLAGAAPPVLVSLVGGPPMGVNINFGGLGSIRGEPISQDGVHNCRGFTQVSSPGTDCPVSSSGWPTTDFVCILAEGQQGQAWMLGTWKCGFTGTGNETISNNGNGHVTKTSAAGNPNVTFDLAVSGWVDGQTVTNVAFGFQVTGTTNGVTGVYAYMPEYGANAATFKHQSNPLSTNEWIAAHGNRQLCVIRFMQAQNVIFNNSVCTSATRNTPSNCITGQNAHGTAELFSQEYCAQLAGDAGCEAWLNVPLGADNTYYTSMAAGIKPYLQGFGGNCPAANIEIGNELWSGDGPGCNAYLLSLSAAYNTANPGVLNYDGNNSAQTLGMRWLATRYHDLATAMQAQFGAAFGTTVKCVYMTQSAGSGAASFLPPFIQFLIHQYGGSPLQWVQALGGDTYSSRDNTSIPGDGTNWLGTTAAPAIVQAEWQRNAQYQRLLHFNETFRIWALKYGMQLWSYEASPVSKIDPGLADATVAAVGAAQQDAGMETTVTYWAQQAFNVGWDRLIFYSSGVDIGNKTGNDSCAPNYPFTSTYSQLANSPKWKGVLDFKNGMLPQHRNQITARGQSILGVNFVNNVIQINPQNPPLTNFGGTGIEGAYNVAWVFQNLAGVGNYQITMNYSGNGGTVNLYVDGALVRAGVACAASPGGTSVVLATVALSSGLHYLEVGTGSSQSITPSSFLFS